MLFVMYWGLDKNGNGKWFTALKTYNVVKASARLKKLDKKGYITRMEIVKGW